MPVIPQLVWAFGRHAEVVQVHQQAVAFYQKLPRGTQTAEASYRNALSLVHYNLADALYWS